MNSTVITMQMRSLWSHCERVVTRRTRRRLARDLHDGLTQDIYATNLALCVLKDRLPAEFRPDVERLIDRQVTMITSARELLHRTQSGEATLPRPEVVDHLVRIARRELNAEPHSSVVVTAPDDLPTRLAQHAGFALREMLSNAVRHSQGSRIEAIIEVTSTSLFLQVIDNGVGLDPYRAEGHGLENLRSRAQSCSGRFTLTSYDGCGTTATWEAPVVPAGSHAERFDSAA